MSALRDEIRAILREEIATLRSEAKSSVERVRITSTAELDRFARDLVERAASPDFSRAVAAGEITFELVGEMIGEHAGQSPSAPAVSAPAIVTSLAPDPAPTLEKTLITERDIAGLERSTRSLRLTKHSRLTPLARDEVRRRGLRIERIAS